MLACLERDNLAFFTWYTSFTLERAPDSHLVTLDTTIFMSGKAPKVDECATTDTSLGKTHV